MWEQELMSRHAIVWIDQEEARVFQVDPDKFDESTIHSPSPSTGCAEAY